MIPFSLYQVLTTIDDPVSLACNHHHGQCSSLMISVLQCFPTIVSYLSQRQLSSVSLLCSLCSCFGMLRSVLCRSMYLLTFTRMKSGILKAFKSLSRKFPLPLKCERTEKYTFQISRVPSACRLTHQENIILGYKFYQLQLYLS